METKLKKRSWAEPYKMKMVELLKVSSRPQRQRAIREAGYNTFRLKSEDVYIDLLTDSGTNAMSDAQWGSLMQGDEAYAGSKSYYKLEAAIQKHYGYKYIIPTHQGRGAENILSQVLIKKGDIVPGNMYFTTTHLHQELAGGKFTDIIIDEAHNAHSENPFKGNVDINKLEKVVKRYGSKRIPYISIATNVNMAGGQPLSMANLKELRDFSKKHKIRIIHDMTRVAENAFFIQQREKGYQNKSLRSIVKEICNCTDGATMSAKKDALVNIGGFLALNDDEKFTIVTKFNRVVKISLDKSAAWNSGFLRVLHSLAFPKIIIDNIYTFHKGNSYLKFSTKHFHVRPLRNLQRTPHLGGKSLIDRYCFSAEEVIHQD